jgi:ABC-type multidrug transport system fused ATPase/permease subunit
MRRGGGYGHFEEDHLGKPYDLGLVRRLLPFARPYRLHVALSLCLILFITGLDLLLPYLTKTAIDHYIIPAGRKIVTQGLSPEEADRVRRALGPSLLASNEPGTYFALPKAIGQLDRRQVAALEHSGALKPEKYYPAPLERPEVARMAAARPGLFHPAGPYAFADYDRLRALNTAELLRLRQADVSGIGWIATVFVALLALSFLFNVVQSYTMELVGQKMMFDLRLRLFGHLQSRSVAFFGRQPVGRLVTRVTNDIENLQEMFTSVLVALFKDTVLALGIVVVLLKLDLSLALVSISLVPIVAVTTIFFSRAARGAFREIRVRIAQINASLSENIRGLKVVQAFRRERENVRRFEELNHKTYLAGMRQIMVFAVFSPTMELLGACAVALIIWYGGGQVLRDRLTLGLLVAFIAYMQMFFKPVRDLGEKYNMVQSAMASAERIFGLLDSDEADPEPATPAALPATVRGGVEFRNVSFSYDGSERVLHNVSFRAAPGETVAIVGMTGAGKSSIINLLERFYEPDEGEILLDGIDTAGLPKTFLRSQIGLVMQDVFLFARSVADNIGLGRSLTPEEIERVAGYANASRLIDRLPGGLSEELHEEGLTLSAGERQLLALARALAYDPRVLVLDEATSSVDTETERLIQEALERLMKGRTTIAIAHRLSTIQRADRILVLHKGRIREEGTHAQLLARRGIYWRLYEMQYQRGRENGGAAASPAPSV